MKEMLATIGALIGTLGGWEMVKYLINRKTNSRINESQADSAEFSVLRETVTFLQEQLRDKEKRFAEQTDVVRELNSANLRLTGENEKLKTERAMKLCERRGCAQREPQSGY